FSRDWSSDVCSSDLEKRTRSWRSSPRARTPTRGRSRDRPDVATAGGGDLDEEGVRAARCQPLHDPAPPSTARARTAATAAVAARSEERRVGKEGGTR